MENSDIDDDFTLDGKALYRNKKEKDLRKKEDLLALVIMVRVAMRLDDDDDVVVLVAIVLAPANIIRVCLARLLSGRSDVNAKRLQSLHFSPNNTRTQHRNRRHTNTQMLFSLPSFMNRKPFRRFLILFLVFVLIPFSGRMFYIQKLDFLQHRQQRNVSLVLHHLNKSSSNNATTTETTHHPQVEQQQQQQQHEEEEKRLLEGNPLANG